MRIFKAIIGTTNNKQTGSLKWDNFITFHANDKPISDEQENYSCVVEDFYLDIISVPYDAINVLKIIPGDPPLLEEYDSITDIETNKSSKMGNKKAKWTSGVLAHDKCVYCCPGTSGTILKIRQENGKTILNEFKILEPREVANKSKVGGASSDVVSSIEIKTDAPSVAKDQALSTVDFNIDKHISFSDYFEKMLHYPIIINGSSEGWGFPNEYAIPAGIGTMSGVNAKFYHWDGNCYFSKIIDSKHSKSLFCIPWTSQEIVELFPNENELDLRTASYKVLTDSERKYFDAEYNPKNHSIYCIPWETPDLLQIIPRPNLPPLFKLFDFSKIEYVDPTIESSSGICKLSFNNDSFKDYILNIYDKKLSKNIRYDFKDPAQSDKISLEKIKKAIKELKESDKYDSILLDIIDAEEFNKATFEGSSPNGVPRKVQKYSKGVLGMDLNLYLIPFDNDNVVRINIEEVNPLIDPIFDFKYLNDGRRYE